MSRSARPRSPHTTKHANSDLGRLIKYDPDGPNTLIDRHHGREHVPQDMPGRGAAGKHRSQSVEQHHMKRLDDVRGASDRKHMACQTERVDSHGLIQPKMVRSRP